MFVQVSGGGRGAEAVDADAQAVQAGVALPAEGRPGLDRDPQDFAVRHVGQDVLAILGALRVEGARCSASTRRRRRSPALRAARRPHRAISTSEPVAIRMTLRAAAGLLEPVGAERTQSSSTTPWSASAANSGGSAPARSARRWSAAAAQHSAVSTASAGRNSSSCGIARRPCKCSIGWWVGPSSPSPTKSWVIT